MRDLGRHAGRRSCRGSRRRSRATPRGRRPRRAAGWPARANPWAGRGAASANLSSRTTVAIGVAASRRSSLTISTAVRAASSPLWPSAPPARSIACSRLSVVSTPNTTGTPVSSATACDARRALPRHVVEVRRVAPDHRAEADDGVDCRCGECLRDQRHLERAGHPAHR